MEVGSLQPISSTEMSYHLIVDIAAGAPYGGEEGSGMVYIFMGGRGGVITKAAQAIAARQVGPALSTFGWSLSGGIDMDGNQYPGMTLTVYRA